MRKKTNYISVAEPEPGEPKLFRDLEPEQKINFNEHFLQSVLEDARMKERSLLPLLVKY